MSLMGAHVLLAKEFDLPIAQNCVFRVVNSEGRQVFVVDALVHWNCANHVGLALANVSYGTEHAIRKMIGMNLGADSLLNRDLGTILRPIQSRSINPA